jgi:hypothetical protein
VRETGYTLSPGIRWAYNFASGLQIVPGIAFPIGFSANRDQRAVLLYLSFEHVMPGLRRSTAQETSSCWTTVCRDRAGIEVLDSRVSHISARSSS